MKRKLFSLVLSAVLASSAVTPCIAAAAGTQYDIAAYTEEHFRRTDGTAVHFLDPTEQAFCERAA